MIELQTAWGWPVALYLFLGGLGGGMFLAATVLGLVRRKRHRRARAVSFWAAFACVAVGLLSLLAEVVLPGRALLVWQSFSHLSSWMALGAWGALAALVLFFVTAFLTTKKTSRLLSIVWEAHPGLRGKVRTACSLAGLAPALFLAFYTGMLLRAAPGVPFWHSALLPCLFVVERVGGGDERRHRARGPHGRRQEGLAPTAPDRRGHRHGRRGGRRRALVPLRGDHAARRVGPASTQRLAAQTSAEMLLSGGCAVPFWGLVVAGGLVAPFVLSALEPFA